MEKESINAKFERKCCELYPLFNKKKLVEIQEVFFGRNLSLLKSLFLSEE